MNGFKDGASSDSPFDSAEDEEGAETESHTPPATDDQSTESVSEQDPPGTEQERTTQPRETAGASSSRGLPWIYQRTSITDGREKTVQLHLRSTTLDEQRQGLAEVEGILGESVKKADLREAAYLVGLNHLDEVAATLRDWGYDFE
jgi:hypothetical protein